MARSGRVRINYGLSRKIRQASKDAIARDMMRRGINVESAAKRRISANPKRIDTGRLRSSIRARPIVYRGYGGARIGTNVKYAAFVHNGTGIFGPRHAPITPRRKKFLRFTTRAGDVVFAKKVKGMRANPFLTDALPAAAK